MDFLMHFMLDRQMLPDGGLKILRKILEKHQTQRPPYSIEIFTKADSTAIIEFCISTFFRHYSLYEFAFKPRMELVLKVEGFSNQRYNAE